jgi:hypothetical protein
VRPAARALSLAVLCAPLVACAPPKAAAAPEPTLAAWRSARARLAAIRAQIVPRTLRLSLSVREPSTGRVIEARGAVAVDPPEALRMILLGPGGTTALDLWIRGDRYRFAVPAIDLQRRGDGAEPRSARRGLPVDFLRWWLLRPAEGRLFWASREGSADRLLLRDGEAVVDLIAREDGRIEARRTSFSTARPAERLDEETVEAEGLGCAEVRYRQASTGLTVTVRCEGETRDPPNPKAFADPDAASEEAP